MLEWNKLHDIVDEMKEHEVFEDRREYTPHDLQSGYALTEQESEDLYYLIQREFDPSIPKDMTPSQIPSWVHKEYWHEASFGNYEGFTEHERITLEKMYDDMCRYWSEVRKDKTRDPITGRTPDRGYGSDTADQ